MYIILIKFLIHVIKNTDHIVISNGKISRKYNSRYFLNLKIQKERKENLK